MTAPHHITGIYTLDSLLTLNLPALGNSLKHVLLPALLPGLRLALAGGARDALQHGRRDQRRTISARPAPRACRARHVVMRHALRNALIPTTTLLGLQVGNLLGGAFLVEMVFSWPGIGFYSVNAIQNFDYQAIMSITVILAVIYTLVNLAGGLLYTKLDPRIELA